MALASQVPANRERCAGGPRQPPGVESADATYENKQDLILTFSDCIQFDYRLRGILLRAMEDHHIILNRNSKH